MELGILLSLMATFAWGAGDVFARKAMFTVGTETVLLVVIVVLAVVLGVMTLTTQGLNAFASLELRAIALTAASGFFAWVTGNFLYFHAMKRAGVTLAAPILGSGPLFAIALAVIFAGERPNIATLVGAGAIVIGVAVILTDRKRVLL